MRAFIAVEVPEDITKKVADIQTELSNDSIKLVPTENMHLTLRFLGNEVKEDQVKKIKEIIDSLKFEPFTVKCKGVGVFPNPHYIRVVWAGIDSNGKLEEVNKELNEKLEALDFEKEPFTSHLTIARVRKRMNLDEFIAKHKDDSFGEFAVKEMKLKRSQIMPGGSVYTDL